MARTKGSTNKTTQTKRQIQSSMKDKPKRTRTVKPKAIVDINENYRILLDVSNYVLQRKLAVGEVAEKVLDELEEDEEVEVISIVPDADRWSYIGYYSPNSNGMAHLLDVCCHDLTSRQLQDKRVKLPQYMQEFRTNYSEIKNQIRSVMKV